MAEAPFIPSALPHSVEMPQGSAIAKSRSGKTGTDIRRTQKDEFAPDQEILVEPHRIVLQGSAAGVAPLPRDYGVVSASEAQALATAQKTGARAVSAAPRPADRPVYDTAGADMDFPARFIKLKIANEAVRAQLQSLESLMRDDG
jgi:hypothetical protein